MAFASIHGLRRDPLVEVAVLWFSPLGCAVLWFRLPGFPFLMPPRLSNVPIPLPSFSPSSFRAFAMSIVVACLHAEGTLATSHLFTAAFFCLSWLWLPFSSYLSSSLCRVLLPFFPCSSTTFRGFSALVLDQSLTSSVALRFSFLLSVVLGRLRGSPFPLVFLSCQWFSCVFCLVCFSFHGVSRIALLGFPIVVLLGGSCLFSACPSCSWFSCWSLGTLLPQLYLRFPPRRSPPFGPRQFPFGFPALLLIPCPAHAFLVPLHWSLSASLLLFLLSCSPLPVGHFFFGVRPPLLGFFPSEVSVSVPSLSFRGFSLGMFSFDLSSALFSVSTSFQQFLPGVV